MPSPFRLVFFFSHIYTAAYSTKLALSSRHGDLNRSCDISVDFLLLSWKLSVSKDFTSFLCPHSKLASREQASNEMMTDELKSTAQFTHINSEDVTSEMKPLHMENISGQNALRTSDLINISPACSIYAQKTSTSLH